MLVVALTGGIGSGKSTVADRFADLNVPVIDADRISHELTAPGGVALEAIFQTFGPAVRRPDGGLDRAALRRTVFSDPAARRRLEDILHPLIRDRMLARLSAVEASYAVLVVPLLFETDQTDLADRVLVVDLPEADQISRTQQRDGLDVDEIRRILSSQVTRSLRLERADDVIDNSGAMSALNEQVDRLHRLYLALARSGTP